MKFAWVGALLTSVAAGCSSLPPAAITQITQADESYRLARFDDVERSTGSVIREYGGHAQTAEAYYLRALARIRRGRRDDARSDLRAGLRLCKRDDLRGAMSHQLANLAYDDADYSAAATWYEASAVNPPAGMQGDDVRLKRGNALMRSGDFSRARQTYRRLAATNKGDAGQAARRKLEWDVDYFSIQCGAFSTPQRAIAAARELRQKGLDVSTRMVGRGGRARHLVLVGKYATHSGAMREWATVKRYQPDAFIVP
jgi:tetratricopeptide (TPR) repeat protein